MTGQCSHFADLLVKLPSENISKWRNAWFLDAFQYIIGSCDGWKFLPIVTSYGPEEWISKPADICLPKKLTEIGCPEVCVSCDITLSKLLSLDLSGFCEIKLNILNNVVWSEHVCWKMFIAQYIFDRMIPMHRNGTWVVWYLLKINIFFRWQFPPRTNKIYPKTKQCNFSEELQPKSPQIIAHLRITSSHHV